MAEEIGSEAMGDAPSLQHAEMVADSSNLVAALDSDERAVKRLKMDEPVSVSGGNNMNNMQPLVPGEGLHDAPEPNGNAVGANSRNGEQRGGNSAPVKKE